MIEIKIEQTVRSEDTHESITHVLGRKNGVGELFWWTREGAAALIDDAKTHTFYTHISSKTALVGVVYPQKGARYLRTHADGYYNDNLLALPIYQGKLAA